MLPVIIVKNQARGPTSFGTPPHREELRGDEGCHLKSVALDPQYAQVREYWARRISSKATWRAPRRSCEDPNVLNTTGIRRADAPMI
jgi:hypothetical protein